MNVDIKYRNKVGSKTEIIQPIRNITQAWIINW